MINFKSENKKTDEPVVRSSISTLMYEFFFCAVGAIRNHGSFIQIPMLWLGMGNLTTHTSTTSKWHSLNIRLDMNASKE